MDDNKSNEIKENSNNESQELEKNAEKSQTSSKSITEKKKARLENAINIMLDQVMEDPDDTTNNSNSNNLINTLHFNDDESNEEDLYDFKMGFNFNGPRIFNRSNKRLKTVMNYPVNIKGMPIMNINQFNFNNKNNIYTMRAPSLGDNSHQDNSIYSNMNSYNQYNCKSSNSSVNNLKIEQNYNNQIKNNNIFLRNANPYSKTVIHHYPIGMFNAGIGFNMNNNLQNLKSNFENNININNNNNNPTIKNNINDNSNQNYKRSESRKKTYPNFNNNDNYPKNINNNILMVPNYNQIFYQNHNNLNQINYNTEYLIFQLKFNLERNGKIDHYIYSLVKGVFINIIKNQKGSKIFQKYLKSTHCDILHQIFLELKPNLEEIITDFYANYFCKRFFTFLNQKDRIDFLLVIEKSLVKLSSDSIGTYPIQTIIEHVGSKNEKNIIINALKDHIKELSFDPFGCHVIEKLLSCFEEEYVGFIYNYIVDNFLELAYNNNGICVVKKILSLTHKTNLHDKLKIIVKENAKQLISHPYGNFVIQVVVECWNDYEEILCLFDKKYYSLSLEKYGSNVVERCIEKDDKILNNYIDEIVNMNKICEVMKSIYGNYVIQKALKLAKGDSKQKLVYNSAKNVNKLVEQKLIKKWKSILSIYIDCLTNEQVEVLKEQNFF
jgi:hypothetical protein